MKNTDLKKYLPVIIKIAAFITVNIIVLIILLFFTDYFLYLKTVDFSKKNFPEYITNKNFTIPYSHRVIVFDDLYEKHKSEFREPSGIKYKKRPIVIFGCSFAYGLGLKDNETLSYQLSEYTERPVYNRAYPGWGMQHMLYQLSREDFYREVKEPEYIIFLYNPEMHNYRLYLYTFLGGDNKIYLQYTEKDGKLRQIKNLPKFIRGSYITKELFRLRMNIKTEQKNLYDCADFGILHFKQAKEEAEKHYKNTKYVILFYDKEVDNSDIIVYIKEKLTENGFEVITTSELVGRIYECPKDCITETDNHPPKSVWKELVPKLAKKLNM